MCSNIVYFDNVYINAGEMCSQTSMVNKTHKFEILAIGFAGLLVLALVTSGCTEPNQMLC